MRLDLRQVPESINWELRDMFEDDELVITDDEDIVDLGTELAIDMADELGPHSDSEEDDDGEVDRDDAETVFRGHSGSVFCGDLHPTQAMAVTGGEDNKAYLWCIFTGDKIGEFKDFEDSVCEVKFSFDGKYVAAADMCGDVQVFASKEGNATIWREKVEDIRWMEWHKQAHVLMCGCAEGNTYMWKVPSGECKVFPGDSDSTVGLFMPDGKRAVIGYKDGSVKVFNLQTGEVMAQFKEKDWGLLGVTSIAAHPNNNLVCVGDSQARVALITSQQPAKLLKECCLREVDPDTEDCVENLAFVQDQTLSALVISTNSHLYVYDYNKQAVRHCMALDEGITKLTALEGTCLVGMGSVGGGTFVGDVRTATLTHRLAGHSDTVLYVAYSKLSNTLLTTSDDGTARIFCLDNS